MNLPDLEAVTVTLGAGSSRVPRSSAADQAFADYVRTLTSWRRLPYLDPALPPELCPTPWSGVRAADLFFALEESLEKPAHAYVESVTGR